MLFQLVGVVLGGGQGKSWCDNTLDTVVASLASEYSRMEDVLRRVVCQVQEECDSLHRAVLFEIPGKEPAGFQVNTHSTEDNGEVVFVVIMDALGGLDQTGLTTDLSSDFVMWETGGREDWDLLTTGDGVHGINGGDTGRNHLFWVHLWCKSAARHL